MLPSLCWVTKNTRPGYETLLPCTSTYIPEYQYRTREYVPHERGMHFGADFLPKDKNGGRAGQGKRKLLVALGREVFRSTITINSIRTSNRTEKKTTTYSVPHSKDRFH